jgi:hypothetical protein
MGEFQQILRGEWFWCAMLYEALTGPDLAVLNNEPGRKHDPEHLGWAFYMFAAPDKTIAIVRFTGRDDITVAHAEYETPEAERACRELFARMERYVERARDFKRHNKKISADAAIESYYRSRAQGGKTTLAEIAHRYGFNESYLRQAKMAYDRAGKWGSKRKVKREET